MVGDSRIVQYAEEPEPEAKFSSESSSNKSESEQEEEAAGGSHGSGSAHSGDVGQLEHDRMRLLQELQVRTTCT